MNERYQIPIADLTQAMGGAVIIGNAGRDVKERKTQGGKAIHSVSVGVYAGKDKTTWVKLDDFNGKLAGVRKGDKIAAFGALKVETYNKKDGGQGVSVELVVSDVAIRGKRADSGPQPSDLDDADVPF